MFFLNTNCINLQNQRALERMQRELDREKRKLEIQEKKLVQEIKKSARNGQINAARIQAKDLVRTKRYVEKFDSMKTQLQAISLRIQAVKSNDQMAISMREATMLLAGMNRSMNLPQLQRITMEFEKQNDLMDQRQEFMDDAIDDAMNDEIGEDDEANEIVNKVLDEIGVDLNTKLHDVPQYLSSDVSLTDSKTAIPESMDPNTPICNIDYDLQTRLNSLKR